MPDALTAFLTLTAFWVWSIMILLGLLVALQRDFSVGQWLSVASTLVMGVMMLDILYDFGIPGSFYRYIFSAGLLTAWLGSFLSMFHGD